MLAGPRPRVLPTCEKSRGEGSDCVAAEVHEAEADIVLVTRDRHFNYAKLAMAAEALHLGARLVVACPDLSHPGPRRQPVPEAGALAAAVVAAGAVTRNTELDAERGCCIR